MSQSLVCILKNRGALRLAGPDTRAFLQGLVSNDVNACQTGNAIYAALLTPQGKFLHDLFIIDDGESLLLDCEVERADDLRQLLQAYKLRAKVTFENVSAAYDVWAAWDLSSSRQKRESIVMPAQAEASQLRHTAREPDPIHPPLCEAYLFENGARMYVDPRLRALGHRIILKKTAQLQGIERAHFNDYDCHRLAFGIPDGSRDMIVGKSTLLECNFDRLNGISWSKGCYMGQELTARMHHRALVKKRLFSVKICSGAPKIGLIVRDGDADVGDMRSSNGDLGLALLNIEKANAALKDKKSFTCGDSQLFVLASHLSRA